MGKRERDIQVLQHIIRYCCQVDETIRLLNITQQSLETEFLHQNALTMPIFQIGELAKHLSDSFIQEFDEMPWQSIRGLRNRVDHVYEEIDYEIIWYTATQDIPMLKDYTEKALKCFEQKTM